MKNSFYISFKMFLKGSKKPFYSLFGIILGISILVISFSLMDGYRNFIEKTLRNVYPPLLIKSNIEVKPPDFITKRAKIIREDLFEGLLITKKELLSRFVFCRVREDQSRVVIGKKLSEFLNLKEKEGAFLAFKTKDKEKITSIKIEEIKKFGLSFLDEAYIILPSYLLGENFFSFGIYPENEKEKIKIENYLRNDALWKVFIFEEIIEEIIAPLKIVEWSIGFVLSLITLVATFSLITRLLIDMREKRFSFAVLYALGMKRREIVLSFFIYSFFLGITGIIGGIFFGLIVSKFINLSGLLSFPEAMKGVYFVEKIYLIISFKNLFYILLFGIFLVLLISVFTNLFLRKIDLKSALRFE